MGFSEQVKIELSLYAGGNCSKPSCRRQIGIKTNTYVQPLGNAAHIVAEREDGPRGKSPLTLAQRNLAENGLWLCPTCHSEIDYGPNRENFTVGMLHQWKESTHEWFLSNQGKTPLEIGHPNVRPQLAIPDPKSLQGATAFLNLHKPLANALWQLRFVASSHYHGVYIISDTIETHILQLSSKPSAAKSWKSEWNSTYYCPDIELRQLMEALVHVVDALQRTSMEIFNGRTAVFYPPDLLASRINKYLYVFEALSNCIDKYTGFTPAF